MSQEQTEESFKPPCGAEVGLSVDALCEGERDGKRVTLGAWRCNAIRLEGDKVVKVDIKECRNKIQFPVVTLCPDLHR